MEGRFRAIFGARYDVHAARAVELEADHLHALAHVDALLGRVVEQELVELAPVHLEGRAGTCHETVGKRVAPLE